VVVWRNCVFDFCLLSTGVVGANVAAAELVFLFNGPIGFSITSSSDYIFSSKFSSSSKLFYSNFKACSLTFLFVYLATRIYCSASSSSLASSVSLKLFSRESSLDASSFSWPVKKELTGFDFFDFAFTFASSLESELICWKELFGSLPSFPSVATPLFNKAPSSRSYSLTNSL